MSQRQKPPALSYSVANAYPHRHPSGSRLQTESSLHKPPKGGTPNLRVADQLATSSWRPNHVHLSKSLEKSAISRRFLIFLSFVVQFLVRRGRGDLIIYLLFVKSCRALFYEHFVHLSEQHTTAGNSSFRPGSGSTPRLVAWGFDRFRCGRVILTGVANRFKPPEE